MSEPVQQNLKVTDQATEKTIQKTPEAVKDGGVIAAQPNQEVHEQAFANAHQNDKTLSEPDMIAMNDGETVAQYKARVAQIQANRFGFFDSEEEKTNDAGAGVAGRTKMYEHQAKQAVELLPDLSPTMQKIPFDSSVKINVQITNVPEVSEAVQQEALGKFGAAVLENAAAAVRQVENHLAQPNAINSDFRKIGQLLSEGPGHFAQSPEQLNKDVNALATSAMEEIDKPLSIDERAKMAGIMLPMFFFEGGKEPINPETVEQMGLEGLTETELKALGIEKRVEELGAVEAESIGDAKGVKSSEIVNQEAFEMDIQPKPASLSNIEARDWYNAQVSKIDAVEQTMREAGKTQQEIFEVTTEIRNQAKQLARDFMKDRRAAARLDKESPIKPKEEYLEKYGGDYEKAIEASKRTNAQVNKRIEELRKERDKDS